MTVDFDALEAEVAELLTLLQDHQSGMTAFYPLAAEHVQRINKLAAKLLRGSDDPVPPDHDAGYTSRCRKLRAHG